jgi:hypothetical protein
MDADRDDSAGCHRDRDGHAPAPQSLDVAHWLAHRLLAHASGQSLLLALRTACCDASSQERQALPASGQLSMAPTAGKLREFREAVYALSAHPGTGNIDRYLTASRALDHDQAARRPQGAVGATPVTVSRGWRS